VYLDVMSKYSKKKSLSKEIQGRIINYLDYMHQGNSLISDSKKIDEVIVKLPINL
jgi:hypothetical protein